MSRYVDVPDDELAALLRTDDQSAFAELYNRYWDKLFSIACHRLADEEEAQEVVQEVFFGLWKRRATFHLRYNLATYLSVCIKYQVINRLAKRHRSRLYVNSQLNTESGENYTDLWLFEKELRLKLDRCVNQLPDKCRMVFQLSRNEGKSTKQIAKDLNIAEKTVEAHITKALAVLKNALFLFFFFILLFLFKI